MKPLLTSTLIFGLVVLGFSSPASAWVKDISLERVFVGKQTRVLQVDVRCRLDNNKRALRKVVSTNSQWCAVELPALCAERKLVAARQLCEPTSSEYRELVIQAQDKPLDEETPSVASSQPVVQPEVENDVDSRSDLLQEKMLIEERRILLEARRIELRQLEIALKKELADISQTSRAGAY